MIAPIKLGWVAGVIDLKGRLIHKRNKKRAHPQIVLTVESKEVGVIRELSNLTGTRPETIDQRPLKDWMRRGCSEHCPEAHIHIHDLWDTRVMPKISRWTITGAGMYVVMANVLPFIQIDRGYTEAMEEVRTNVTLEGQGSGAVIASLARLSALGWDLPPEFRNVMTDVASKMEVPNAAA